MSSVNTSSIRGGAAPSRARAASHADRLAAMRAATRATVEPVEARVAGAEPQAAPGVEITTAIGDFIAPPAQVSDTLGDPRLGNALRGIAARLEQEGNDPSDRYAAAVLRTHLEARNRLALRANALIKA